MQTGPFSRKAPQIDRYSLLVPYTSFDKAPTPSCSVEEYGARHFTDALVVAFGEDVEKRCLAAACRKDMERECEKRYCAFVKQWKQTMYIYQVVD